jgi:2-polyprenyl-3-methyl-5-hydroxy-6-metoxy-1,4-benzoquinol methylase
MNQDTLEEIARRYNSCIDFDYHIILYGLQVLLSRVRGDSMLEIGCANGVMTGVLARRFKKVVVVDASEYYISEIKNLYPSVECHISLIENFQTKEKFDNIVMARIMEHLEDPVGCLQKIKNWLMPKGAIHIIVPNAYSFHRRLGVKMRILKDAHDFSERDVLFGHRRVYDKDLIMRHVESAGLGVEEIVGIFIKPLSNKQMENWEKSILDGLFKLGIEMPDLCNELYLLCERKS